MAGDGRSNFWSSLPGVLTGLAAVMTASVAMFAVVRGPATDRSASATQAASVAPTPTAQPSASATQAIASTAETSPGCAQGLVWRGTRPNDRTCVTPARRQAVAEENALALDRREPAGGAYGVNTCRAGFVWRVATEDDLTCVTPASRDEVARENG